MSSISAITMGREAANVLLTKLEKIEKSDRMAGFNETEVEAASAYLEKSGIKTGPSGITAKNLTILKSQLRDTLKKLPEDKIVCAPDTKSSTTRCKVLKQELKIEFKQGWKGGTDISVMPAPHAKRAVQSYLKFFGLDICTEEKPLVTKK
ncbi:MAG: hypothetical protein HN337_09810 [Deltaproteobacteria bacterium]|jgi:hypothetical protein|nr:hypothetical protein [Deltaproteobacteria bacterium]